MPKLSPPLLALLRSLENALLLAGISAALVFVTALQVADSPVAIKAAGIAALAALAKGGLQALNDALSRAKMIVPTDTVIVTADPNPPSSLTSADTKGMAS